MFERILSSMLKVLLFAALFAASAFIVNIIYNVNWDKVSKETGNPELPTVSVCREGDIMNRMKGYKTKLGTRLNRDLVVPLDDKKGIEVIVEGKYSGQVKYELRDISGENLIENGEMELLGTANTDSSTGFLRLSGIVPRNTSLSVINFFDGSITIHLQDNEIMRFAVYRHTICLCNLYLDHFTIR